MTIDTITSPAVADVQDPLPESKWFWRRLFVFLTVTAVLYMTWGWGDRLSDIAIIAVGKDAGQAATAIKALLSAMHWTIGFAGLTTTFYLVAPSAEQTAKMMSIVRGARDGVVFSSKSKTDTQAGTSEASAAAGKPVEPSAVLPVPGAAAAAPYEGPELPPATDAKTPDEPAWPR